MCQKCLDAVEEILKDFNDDTKNYIIWNETAFPFCDPDTFRKQLLEYVGGRKP